MIIGVGELAQSVGKKIKEATWTGLDVIGFVNNNPNNGRLNTIGDNKIFSDLNEIATIVDQNQVNEVWIALPLQEEDQIKEILNLLRHSVVTIRFVPGIFEYRLLNHTVDEIAGLPVIDLNATPMVGVNRVLKALEDRLLSLLILILVSPLLALIALSIKLTSKGPVLFKQMRLGWDGKPIKIYKFRTMIVHKEDDGKITQAKKGDQRITTVGTFLRKTSMDELPQFWNVLQGRMSIVGPRPHALIHNEQYKLQIDEYMQRHKVKPGITGWAQIHGWRGETDTLEKMKRRVEYDLYYIENWSLWLDLKIILYTLFAGFINKNAY